MYGMPPKPGLWVQAMLDSEKKELGIPTADLGLKVRGVFGKDVRKSGLKKGDVIVQFADQRRHRTEGEFHAQLRLGYYKPNSVLPLQVNRQGKLLDISVEFPN